MPTPICPRCGENLSVYLPMLGPDTVQQLHAQAHRSEDYEILRITLRTLFGPYLDAFRQDEPIDGSDAVDLLQSLYHITNTLNIFQED
jgi:hypothetical protein